LSDNRKPGSPRGRVGASSGDGFALVLVLCLGALLSTGAVVLLRMSHGVALDLDVARRDLEVRAASYGGVAVAVAAIAGHAPPTAAAELPPVAVGTRTVRVTIANESAKVDVNAAASGLVDAALSGFPASTRMEVLDRLSRFRASGEFVPDVSMLLPPCIRSTSEARRLANVLTTATWLPTVSRRLAPRLLLTRLPGMTSLQLGLIEADREGKTLFDDDPRIAPVARYLGGSMSRWLADVTVDGGNETSLTREAVLDSEGHKYPSVVWSRDVPSSLPPGYCL